MIVTRPVRALERTATDLNSENTALATQLLKIAEVAPGVICSFKLKSRTARHPSAMRPRT